jgi:hypothetical protein
MAIAAVALALTACTSRSQAPTQGSLPSKSLANPTAIALLAPSTIIDVHPIVQTVPENPNTPQDLSGTYAGTEVLAETPATMDQLHAWLGRIAKSPPAGLTARSVLDDSVRQLNQYGVDVMGLGNGADPSHRGILVVVMDPRRVHQGLGVALDLIGRYRDLPDALRKPIDDRMKSQVGFTASEALDPSAPLGMTLAAVQRLQSTDDRAIIGIDVAKRTTAPH